jgi:hypothetical protein
MLGLSESLGMNNYAVETPLNPLLLSMERIWLTIKLCTCATTQVFKEPEDFSHGVANSVFSQFWNNKFRKKNNLTIPSADPQFSKHPSISCHLPENLD